MTLCIPLHCDKLFAGPFNSEKRSAAPKLQTHHSIHDHTQGIPPSPDTSVNHGHLSNKLSVGGPVKLGKHNSIERFNSLGIQGGVLAGVASPSHSHPNARRRGDNELDSNGACHSSSTLPLSIITAYSHFYPRLNLHNPHHPQRVPVASSVLTILLPHGLPPLATVAPVTWPHLRMVSGREVCPLRTRYRTQTLRVVPT